MTDAHVQRERLPVALVNVMKRSDRAPDGNGTDRANATNKESTPEH